MQIDRTDSIAMGKQTKFELLKQELNLAGTTNIILMSGIVFPTQDVIKAATIQSKYTRGWRYETRAKDVKGKEEFTK